MSNNGEREEEIRRIAYRLWEEDGCPEGRDVEHYFRAEAIWKERQVQLVQAPQAALPAATAPTKQTPQAAQPAVLGQPARARKQTAKR
jgi:hypothetical protein